MPKHFFQRGLKLWHILFTVLLVSSPAAQEHDVQSEAEAEALIEVMENLDGLRLNVNRASQSDLLALPGLTPDLAWRITAFRPYKTLKDLSRVPGLSTEHIDALTPYLSLVSQKRWTGRSTIRLSHSTTQKAPRLYQRHEIALSNHISGAFLTERDPGESQWTDLVSGYLQFNTPAARVTLGGLRPEFGQGLIFSRRTRSATGLSFATPRNTTRVGNRSTDEAGVLRGVLIANTHRWISWTALYAQSHWDADTDRGGVYRVYRSGLHDSETSRLRKDALHERLSALHLTVGNANRAVGITAVHTRFTPQQPAASSTHQIALDTQWRTSRLALFGETALTPQDHAWLFGSVLQLDDLRIHLIGRRFGPHFHSLRGGAFAAYGTPPNNEWGAFLGATWPLTRRTRVELSLDRHGQVLPEDQPLPKRGQRVRIRLTRRLPHKAALRLTTDLSAESDRVTRRGLRADLTQNLRSSRLNLWAACNRASVFAHATGARLQLGKPKRISLALWATHFSVPNYDARLYAFESDVWGGGRLVVLTNKGYTSGARLTCAMGPVHIATRYSFKHTADQHPSSWAVQIDLQR